MTKDIRVGEFYFRHPNHVVHVAGIDVTVNDPYESGRAYVWGTILYLDIHVTNFGNEINVCYLDRPPLTETQKKKIIAKFVKVGKGDVAKEFFRKK